MRWDYKLVAYLLLTYFISGVLNYFSLNAFVVPLPLSFLFAPLIALTFALKTKPSFYTLLFFGIPLLMLKDLIIYYNENLGILFIVLSLVSWLILGGLILKRAKSSLLLKLNGVSLLAASILLVGNAYLSAGYLSLVLITSFKTLQTNTKQLSEPLERSLLLVAFITALYFLNETSIWLVS